MLSERLMNSVRKVPADMEKSITIGDKTFDLVTIQRGGATGVYKGNGEYLRIGEPAPIKRHLEVHKMMEAAGYPVPRLLAEGEHDRRAYFIEKLIGEKRLNDLFAEDTKAYGAISEEHFRDLLHLVEQFADAQIRTETSPGPMSDLASGIYIEELCKELPEYAEKLRNRFQSVYERLSTFPFVLSHGDFNPRNLFPEGIIDLEDFFQAPFGYDLVTALVHVDLHPDDASYEFHARYGYTKEQKKRYFVLLDRIAAKYHLPAISTYAADFAFCRAVWSTVRMHEWPKIQKWRYDLLIKMYLS